MINASHIAWLDKQVAVGVLAIFSPLALNPIAMHQLGDGVLLLLPHTLAPSQPSGLYGDATPRPYERRIGS